MFSIYCYEDLTYHDHVGLVQKGFPDYETAESFKKELEEGDFSSEYLGHELFVCKELTMHNNEEMNISWDQEYMYDAYTKLLKKYFGETK